MINWKTVAAVLGISVLIGALIGLGASYKAHRSEEIGKKLYEVEKYLAEGKFERAEQIAEDIPEPSKAYALLKLGDYVYSKGNINKALAYYREAEKILRELDKPLYYYTLEKEAYIEYRLREYRKALKILETLPPSAPNACDVELLKGEILLAEGKKEKAKKVLLSVVESCNRPEIASTAKYLLSGL